MIRQSQVHRGRRSDKPTDPSSTRNNSNHGDTIKKQNVLERSALFRISRAHLKGIRLKTCTQRESLPRRDALDDFEEGPYNPYHY